MYKVMIIDDDDHIREWLKTAIDWESLQIELVCEAADSDTAVELYLLHRPKIIISDINIPIISGLELAEILKKEDPDLQFIIITGFDDFELVKQTVRLGAVDLLSKPVHPETINASLKKVVDSFRAKQEKQSSVQFLRQLVDKNLPELQKSFMLNLISNPPEDESCLISRFSQLAIPCPGPNYTIAVVKIQVPQSENTEAQQKFVQDTLVESFHQNGFPCIAYLDSHSKLNCIISSVQKEPDNEVEDIIIKVQEQLHFTSEFFLLAGIGTTVAELSQLYRSRREAIIALKYQHILGNASVMHYKNMAQMDAQFTSQETIHDYLLQEFQEGNLSAIAAMLKKQTENLIKYPSSDQPSAHQFLFEYVQNISKETLRLGLSLNYVDSYIPTLVQLMHGNDAESVTEVVKLTEQILKQINRKKTDEGIRLIDKAKDYVKTNFHDKSLCLESVSDHIGLSKIYFCKLFHQLEGVSFSVYLKQIRIDHAKHLLSTTKLRASEISEAAGFSSPKYFGYVFKQMVGQTPMEYQRNE